MSGSSSGLCALVDKLNTLVINPLMLLLFSGGLLLFVYGVVEYMWGLSMGSADQRDNGRRHLLWGLIGMFIMASSWAIIQLIARSVGTNLDCSSILNM